MSRWSEKLYAYGFLMTDNKRICEHMIGLNWENWQHTTVEHYDIWLHPSQKLFLHTADSRSFLLIGHAYNPFTMENDEAKILEQLASRYGDGNAYYDYFDQLTGIFFYAVIAGNTVTSTCDCTGMMGVYYAEIEGWHYYAAHCQMIAELCDLEEDPYVSRLKSSRFFRLYGWYLPGDRSSYREIRRIIPNTEVVASKGFCIHRYYPRNTYSTVNEDDYPLRVAEIGQILHNNLVLIAEKWKSPAISLTGGTDSKTTLACAADVQERYRYFSYVSLPREAADAKAARDICHALGLEHETFEVPPSKNQYSDFNEVDQLIERHYGYLGKGNENDVCKRIVLSEKLPFDVEVKSWVSEIARASRYKKYNKKRLPSRMTPRRLTSMYKIFTFNRREAIETDQIFSSYMQDTSLQRTIEATGYPWSEFFVWEIVFGGWGSLALTGEHKLTNDITIPYNNRALLDLMLRTPFEKRISDKLHRDIIRRMDHRVEDLGIHVTNGNETKLRAICEGLYFDLHSLWPW